MEVHASDSWDGRSNEERVVEIPKGCTEDVGDTVTALTGDRIRLPYYIREPLCVDDWGQMNVRIGTVCYVGVIEQILA